MVIAVAVAWLAWSVPHLVYHLRHLDVHAGAVTALPLLAVPLVLGIIISILSTALYGAGANSGNAVSCASSQRSSSSEGRGDSGEPVISVPLYDGCDGKVSCPEVPQLTSQLVACAVDVCLDCTQRKPQDLGDRSIERGRHDRGVADQNPGSTGSA